MILRQALPQRRGFFDDVGVVVCLRLEECCFEEFAIANTSRSAVAIDQVSVDGENLDRREIVGHFASFL